MDRWLAVGEQGYGMQLIVAGSNQDSPYGEVHAIRIPESPGPVERHLGSFGMTWGGQLEIVNRIINGHDSSLASLIADFDPALEIDPAKLDAHLRARLAFTILTTLCRCRTGLTWRRS